MRYPPYVLTLRFAFAALLLVTAIGKLLDNRGFAAVVGTYQVFPEPLLLPLSLAFSLAELALGLWLLWGVRLTAAAFGAVLFHLGYLTWLGLAYARGLDIQNCGCFGIFLARPLTPSMFIEDGLLLAAALVFWLGTWCRGPSVEARNDAALMASR